MSNDPNITSPIRFHKGRGTASNRESRFHAWSRESDPNYLEQEGFEDREPRSLTTSVTEVTAKNIISRNASPDIPFDQSINPYMGCEHGCSYCYARPTHAYLGLSPGLDFETKLFAKRNAPELLEKELSSPRYKPAHIALGANTDPYQPIERDYRLTRRILEVLAAHNAPVGITTKSALVARDIDLLAPMAARGLARVYISIGSLDRTVSRHLEPRANSPARRLEAIQQLAQAGIPVGVFTSPLIPALNDADMERILEAAAQSGARYASYVILRLPLEVRDLFVEWLNANFPLRAKHVMSIINQMRSGKDYDARFGDRMRGTGIFADLIKQRFIVATKRLGLESKIPPLETSQFSRTAHDARQAALF